VNREGRSFESTQAHQSIQRLSSDAGITLRKLVHNLVHTPGHHRSPDDRPEVSLLIAIGINDEGSVVGSWDGADGLTASTKTARLFE